MTACTHCDRPDGARRGIGWTLSGDYDADVGEPICDRCRASLTLDPIDPQWWAVSTAETPCIWYAYVATAIEAAREAERYVGCWIDRTERMSTIPIGQELSPQWVARRRMLMGDA